MKSFVMFVFLVAGAVNLSAQVVELNWELDYQIFMKMANDSSYSYDIREVFHITDARDTDFNTEFVFYPVNPAESFSGVKPEIGVIPLIVHHKTLWSALHAKVGGGWVHFANCIAYALEMQVLDLKEPIMERPDSKWKPKPVTESWKRTREWVYYVPLSQKNAITEYKQKVKGNEDGDLKNLPPSIIQKFLTTTDKEYQELIEDRKFKDVAQIDLVKVILGANYLGEPQINYISNAVLSAIKTYSASKLPSVLVFDEFDAAAAMTLDEKGYQLESLVFRKSAGLSQGQIDGRTREIKAIIETINKYNRAAFQKRLGAYYNAN